ncbi:MAG TPA: PEGA domain-containing protein [Terriglobia bacterium]|nr:PEGA domain-containing protein [Terriglobia bacterium]
MCRRRLAFGCVLATLILTATLQGKKRPDIVLVWPSSGKPVLRFTFTKITHVSSFGKVRNYSFDITAENLWEKNIPSAGFSLYLFDKNRARIGDGTILVRNIAPGESVKFQVMTEASGVPDSMTIEPESLPAELQPNLPPKTVEITVNSVPQGADLKVDGSEAGTTPKLIRVTPGEHMLVFSKEGFNQGHFPLVVTSDQASGGSVSFELGTSAHDTVELRDGSVLVGDVESMSASEVQLRIGGRIMHLNRNQVKRILLIQRDEPPRSASEQP